jgi:hypothetical protein
VRAGGFEPPRSLEHGHLKTARLPFRHARNGPHAIKLTCQSRPLESALTGREGLSLRSAQDFDIVRRLIEDGWNDTQIARRTGVPRTTVHGWRSAPPPTLIRRRTGVDCAHDIPEAAYAYLLGMYLGDGHIVRTGRSWRLRIACDTKYPAIITRCRAAIDTVMTGQRAAILERTGNWAEVYLYSNHWPCLLPQHGPGRKHHRRIALEPWQQVIVDQQPEEFVCGLLHSDGCRVVANDRGVASVRYHFSNRSEDIIGLFTMALDALAIPWRRSSRYVVSIYRKAATARLDEFVGPKDEPVPLWIARDRRPASCRQSGYSA